MRAAGYFLAYLLWSAIVRTIALSLITYFLVGNQPRYQDISDSYFGNGVLLSAISAASFLILLASIHPLLPASRGEILTFQKFKTRWFPGFVQGIGLGVVLGLAIALGGSYRFLGWLFPADEAALGLFNALLRTLALIALAFSEEYLFRQKILPALRGSFPTWAAAAITALLYWATKAAQYDLGWMHSITLILIAFSLGLRASREGDFSGGAGLWAGLLVALNPLFGLPVFGSDFPGLLLLKYEPSPGINENLSRWISGGNAGPLASAALQILILAYGWRALRGAQKPKPMTQTAKPRKFFRR